MLTNYGVPELRRKNDKLRIKVSDRCNFHCWFCHAEGAANSNDLVIDSSLKAALLKLHDTFKFVHITGGEPFLYGHLEELIEMLIKIRFSAAITSNGYFELDDEKLRILDKLGYINISFHSLQASYYEKLTGLKRGTQVVDIISGNIQKMSAILPVRINTVVSGDGKEQELNEMIQFANCIGCELKFVPELRTQKESLAAIAAILNRNGYHLFQIIHIIPGSNLRERYQDDDGHIIEVKKLSPYFPDSICMHCGNRSTCDQGYSFLRIGGNPLYCQACIKQPPVLCDEFMEKVWPKLKREHVET